MELTELALRLRSLAVFRGLLDDPVLSALLSYLEGLETASRAESVSRYGAFVSRLYAAGTVSLSDYVKDIAGDLETPYLLLIGKGEVPPSQLETCVARELEVLQAVADLTPALLRKGLDWEGWLPEFSCEAIDLSTYYRDRVNNIGKYGYGIYARHHMFYLNSQGSIVPVHSPDPVRLSDLADYRREQGIIIDNTVALLEGKPAANILLTGDAGTGKSSTIKAVVNELYPRGLRVLELRKDQLRDLPAILDELSHNPLKFILFLDDLSFRKDDEHFGALKAVLEGSVSAKADNIVIYATSNRRHLIRESFSDREGDDIHRNDTMQEIISLSERFGIHITFQKPDKSTYLDIVHHLARLHGVERDREELDLLAERFALERGGRSPRGAAQFIDSLLAAEPSER